MLRKIGRFIKRLLLFLLIAGIVFLIGLSTYNSLRAKYRRIYTAYTAERGDISTTFSYDTNLALIDSRVYTAASDTKVFRVYTQEGGSVAKDDKIMRLEDGSVIKADFAGYVNVLSVEEGDEVKAGDTLAQIADFDHMRVRIRVDEYDIPYFTPGRACTLKLTASERVFETEIATVDYIGSEGGSIAYYTATVDIEPDGDIYPGMQATVEVTEVTVSDTLRISKAALSFDEKNSAMVYVMDDSGEMTERYVTCGAMNDNYVEILSGLSEGETVYKEVDDTITMRDLMAMMQARRQSGMRSSGQNTGNRSNRDYGGFNGGTP